MGKGSDTGVSSGVSSGLQSDADALTKIAMSQQGNADKLFSASFPGFSQATQHAETLASGDPYALSRELSPQIQQITAATTGAKQNILNSAPNGGEKNLALEQADVARGAQVGSLTTNSSNNAFNTLAGLGSQGIGLGQNSTSEAISGLNAGAGVTGQIGTFQLQDQQLQAEQKGSSLGALSSLGGDAATLGAGALAGKGAAGAAAGGSSSLLGLAALAPFI